MQLVILAAGMGRRFGGLKQLAPVGPAGESILDYTVFDALRSGFDGVVLVIRDEIEAAIRDHVDRGFGKHVAVSMAHQDCADRPRPWGTGHAVLAAADHVRGAFGVANADDLYGHEAIAELGRFLAGGGASGSTWGVVGYPIAGTLPSEGAVSRAALTVEHGWLQSIDELLRVDARQVRAGVPPAETLVSMNLWGFGEELFTELEMQFREFVAGDPAAGSEFQLPVVVGKAIREARAQVRVLPTASRWCGMTAAADLDTVRAELQARIAAGVYPDRLWS